MSALEDKLLFQIRAAGLPKPELEFRFCSRRWRLDMAWPEKMIACEVEGGIWTNGRHSRGKGFENDCYKYAEALLLGWQVLRVTTDMIKKGEALQYLEILHGRSDQRQDIQFFMRH